MPPPLFNTHIRQYNEQDGGRGRNFFHHENYSRSHWLRFSHARLHWQNKQKTTTKQLALQWNTFSPVLAYMRLCVRGVGSITSPVCRVSVNGLAALPSCTLPRWGIAGTHLPHPHPLPHLPSPSSAGNPELSKSLFCKPAVYRSIASRVSLISSKFGVFSVRTTSYLIHWPRNVVMSEED